MPKDCSETEYSTMPGLGFQLQMPKDCSETENSTVLGLGFQLQMRKDCSETKNSAGSWLSATDAKGLQ